MNDGEWTSVVANEPVSFGGENGSLRLRGTNINGTADADAVSYSSIVFNDNDVPVACTGDIRTLQDWKNYKTVDTKNARFFYLFYKCVALTSAPDLPATELAGNCYKYMFFGCTNLKAAPALPATTLASYCYYNMFSGCTNLKTAPELPATTLAKGCYSDMFRDCKNLTSVMMLTPSDQITSKKDCCNNWLTDAGTKEGISRTLKVQDKAAYDALVAKGLPAIWQIGKCKVLDKDNKEITE